MSATPTLIVLKTRLEHLDGVLREKKHALESRMTKAKTGDLLLVAEVQNAGPALVRFGMWFENQRLAREGETENIWNGQTWKYIVETSGWDAFAQPFCPNEISDKNLGQGAVAFAYVEEADAERWRREGRLLPLLPPLEPS